MKEKYNYYLFIAQYLKDIDTEQPKITQKVYGRVECLNWDLESYFSFLTAPQLFLSLAQGGPDLFWLSHAHRIMFCCNIDMQSNLERPPFLWLQVIYPNSVRKHHDVGRDLPLFLTAIIYIAPVTKRDVNETLWKEAELCIPKVLHLHSFRKWIYLAGILFI